MIKEEQDLQITELVKERDSFSEKFFNAVKLCNELQAEKGELTELVKAYKALDDIPVINIEGRMLQRQRIDVLSARIKQEKKG